MTDEQLEAGLRRALRDVRVPYDASGADIMIANATTAPLRPERTAWAAPVAAAAAVVVVGGGAAVLATRGSGGPDGQAPAAGGCGSGASTASSAEQVPLPVSSSVPASVAATPATAPPSAPRPTLASTGDVPRSSARSDSTAAPGSGGRVPPGRPTYTPTSTLSGTSAAIYPLPPSPAVSGRPVSSDPTPRPVPSCLPSDGRVTVPPTASVRVPVATSSGSGGARCIVLLPGTGRVVKRVPCSISSDGVTVVTESPTPRR